MIAILVSCAILLFSVAIGAGVIATLTKKRTPGLVLITPAVGFGVITLVTMWFNRLGIPVGAVALPLAIVLFVAAVFAIWRFKFDFMARELWPVWAIFAVGFILTGRGMFAFGFDWLSYANDDMVNYVIGAERFLSFGYAANPDVRTFALDQDSRLYYWFLENLYNERPGSELLIAFVMRGTGLNSFFAFMPTIMALYVGLLGSSVALVYRTVAQRKIGIIFAAVMATSALTTFGVEYQLIAQIFGLSLLITTVYLFCYVIADPEIDWRACVLAGLSLAASGVVYPEILPFIIGSVLVVFFERVRRRTVSFMTALKALAVSGAATLVLLNYHLVSVLSVLISRITEQAKPAVNVDQSLFPYYLIPSGLSNLFGLTPVAKDTLEPWASIGIFFGIILLAATLVAIVALFFKREPDAAAVVTGMMLLLGFSLFSKRSDFGLFKLAMYVTPFMFATLVVWWRDVADWLARDRAVMSTPIGREAADAHA